MAALVYKSVNRSRLQALVRDATADELGIERTHLSPLDGRRTVASPRRRVRLGRGGPTFRCGGHREC
ncbi:MAG: hypothetical protein ACR2LE_08165 [Nocardioidaceae bacterium]